MFGNAIDTIERIKVSAEGINLPADYSGTDHVAVLFPRSGIMVAVESLGDPGNPDNGLDQNKCIDRCKGYGLLGLEWRIATRAEAVSLIDDTRIAPAIDTNFFPRIKSRWHWTSTDLASDSDAAAGSSPFAWGVHFGNGSVSNDGRSYRGFGLAVCRVGQ